MTVKQDLLNRLQEIDEAIDIADIKIEDLIGAIELLDDDMNPPNEEEPPVDPEESEDDPNEVLIKDTIEQILLNAEQYPNEEVDIRDVIPVISNSKLYGARLRDIPGIGENSPPSIPGTPAIHIRRGTISIYDKGARGNSFAEDTKALVEAAKSVSDGGVVYIPIGKWKIANAIMPGHKDYVIEGESSLGSELVGAAVQDMMIWNEDREQQRLQNRRILRNFRFYLPGNGSLGSFNRTTKLGWKGGAAGIAFVQNANTADGNRKDAWGGSYLTLQNLTARADKNAIGSCLLWSDRALYGFRAENIFLGDHGTNVSGPKGGIVIGHPRFDVEEFTPDEFRVQTLVHWGGEMSICAPNIANGAIIDHKAYVCKYPLHLPGMPGTGARQRCRDLELRELYYDNDVLVTSPNDAPMIYIDSDGCVIGVIHIKGSREGQARPKIIHSGNDFEGGQYRIMSSQIHKSPQFQLSGDQNFLIRAGGVTSVEKATMLNGKASYPGVTVR